MSEKLTYDELMAFNGFLKKELNEANSTLFEQQSKINELEEKLKKNLEFFEWVKEAFGECETDEYVFSDIPVPFTGVPTSLNLFINSFIKENKLV